MEFNGIKVETCQICKQRDKIHLEMLDDNECAVFIVCNHCQNTAPAADEIHQAVALWNRKQQELKQQITLPLEATEAA